MRVSLTVLITLASFMLGGRGALLPSLPRFDALNLTRNGVQRSFSVTTTLAKYVAKEAGDLTQIITPYHSLTCLRTL